MKGKFLSYKQLELRFDKYRYHLFYGILAILITMVMYMHKTPIERNDIYAICPKGDTLSFEVFKKAEKIIKTKNLFYIWLDLYEDSSGDFVYAPHLLICDHNLIVKGASGNLPIITKIVEDTIFGYKTKEYIQNRTAFLKDYRDDLPKSVILNLKNAESNFEEQNQSYNIVVNSMILDSIFYFENSNSAKIYLRYSKEYSFLGIKEYFQKKDFYLKEFDKNIVVDFPISKLDIDRSCSYITIIDTTNICDLDIKGRNFEYLLRSTNSTFIENFLYQIWSKQKLKRK